jgi:spore maturation protein A
MRYLGSLSRWLLNINTIWGLMIASAFLLCAIQHYAPTKTLIPADRLVPGANTITIRAPSPNAADKEDGREDFAYTLTLDADRLQIAADDKQQRPDRPWLISAEPLNEAFVLKWDTQANGTYNLRIGDDQVARGKLVTLQSLTDAALQYAKSGFDIALGLVATMVLFLGLMKVGEDAGIVQIVARVFYPIIRFLFPDVPKDHPASGAILMNWTTTVLGLGNAATPFGLKAMKELESLNPHPGIATDSQVMLLGYNTAGFALLPATLIAVRKAAGCSDPVEIIGTCMVAGGVATVTAIIMVKLLGMLPVFSVRNAVAEQTREAGAKSGEGA